MKNKRKIGLITIGLFASIFAMSSCTANFCSTTDKSKIAFALEPGVSEFYNKEEADNITVDENDIKIELNTNLYQIIKIDSNGNFEKSGSDGTLTTVINSAKNSNVMVPKNEYFQKFDQKVLTKIATASNLNLEDTNNKDVSFAFKEFGSLKFCETNSNDLWVNYRTINDELRSELGYTVAATVDFENLYISSMNQVVDTYRSCITVYDEVEYGNYGKGDLKTVKLEKITWKQAWGKGGKIIEGLVVYPVAWMIDKFAVSFASSGRYANITEAYASGVPQLMSLILVTVIVRLFIFLVTIKSTLSQKKMNELQPELAKIQQKYPNANTNQNEKQRLAEEQMRLYKKNHVNPLSQLLILIIQFPVFIGVWGAMTGSAVLSTGTVLNLDLSQSISSVLFKNPKTQAGWWTAFVLILLMSIGQFFSMKVPQWIQKSKTKKVARLGKNPAQQSQNKTANIVSYVILIMIIVMGFTLPAAMGVYWFIGAIVSLLQTILTNYAFVSKKHK